MTNWTRRGLLGSSAGLAFIGGLPSVARDVAFDEQNLLPGEFSWHPERSPKGAVAIVVSIPEQRVHVYRGGVRIAVSTCSTGKPGHSTPTGVFTVLQKDKDHRSSTYNNAPMPNMNRLTWDGIALHAGNLPGYPASHGCVRLPLDFSAKLFTVTHVGTPVIISGSRSDPWELIHPGVVLGNTAEHEMADAVAGLKARSHPSDWNDGGEYPVTTLLATGADKRVVLIENGEEIMEATMTVNGSPELGEHVLILKGTADGGLAWVGLTHHPDPDQPLKPEAAIANRLIAPPEFHAQVRKRLHPGFVLIVSDLAAHPDRRSGADFVIMDSGKVEAPLPMKKPSGG